MRIPWTDVQAEFEPAHEQERNDLRPLPTKSGKFAKNFPKKTWEVTRTQGSRNSATLLYKSTNIGEGPSLLAGASVGGRFPEFLRRGL